jgi:dihydrofolate reductase
MEKNMTVNVILATELNFGIGNDGDMPWPRNKEDMSWFKQNTGEDIVVMGRKTWDSIGKKKLPNRTNIVITSRDLEGADHVFSGDMGEIIEKIKGLYLADRDIWIMGGAEIYDQAIPYADKLYLTTFNDNYICDTYVEENIVVKFPYVEYWVDKPKISFMIRSKHKDA